MAQKIRAGTVLRNNKKSIKLFFAFCLAGASVANTVQAETSPSEEANTKILKVCYDQWAPMTIFPTQQSAARGVVIDMLEQIYTVKGYTLKYYEVPLARGLDMVAEGLCDMLPEYPFSKNVEDSFEYASEATFAYPSAFVVRQDEQWRYDGVKSLQGKRVATGPGWDYSSMSTDYQRYLDDPDNSNYVEVIAGYDDVVDRIFQMIKENRIDLYADNELVLKHILNYLNLNKELKIVRPGLENKLVELPIFSNKIPDEKRAALIKIWNDGRLSMKGEKENLLLEKYKVRFEE
jgi:polar amino acid transport system substrate-binding protein